MTTRLRDAWSWVVIITTVLAVATGADFDVVLGLIAALILTCRHYVSP